MMQFTKHTKDFWSDILAAYLPDDILWKAKYINGTNIRGLLLSNSTLICDIESKLTAFVNNLNPFTTSVFLEEWEKVLGIPDGCIEIAPDNTTRLKNITFKLNAIHITTEQDFINLAKKLGENIIISRMSPKYPPYDHDGIFRPQYPTGSKSIPFVWMVGGLSANPSADILKCVFKRLKPVHTRVIFQ